jgi:tetratricopeptide (TPR) repeat protein
MNTLLGVIVQLKSLCDGNDTDSDLAVLRDNIAPDLRKIYDAQETGSASLRKNFSSFMKSSNSLDEIPDLASVEAFLDKEGISCAEHTIAYAFLLFAAIKKNEKAVLKPSILKCIETLVHQGKHWHFSVGAEFSKVFCKIRFSLLMFLVCYVVQKYANALFAESQYERALPTLKTAIEKIRTNRKMLLTALHPLLALACLKTRNYDFAADIAKSILCIIWTL